MTRFGFWAAVSAGYAAAAAGGLAAAALHYARMPPQVIQQSGGMVAFGQFLAFVGVGGLLAWAPTYFVLKRFRDRALLWTLAAGAGTLWALLSLRALVRVPLAYLLEGRGYVYPDRAFFNLNVLAWLHYKAPWSGSLWFSPAVFAVLACLWLAAPGGRARRWLGALTLVELAACGLLALRLALIFRDKAVHP